MVVSSMKHMRTQTTNQTNIKKHVIGFMEIVIVIYQEVTK
jgi:hypothetical protein